MKKIWDWFNGNKTAIGATVLIVLKALLAFGVGIPPNIVEGVEIIGYGLTTLGVGHKGEKWIKKQGGIKKTINKLKKK